MNGSATPEAKKEGAPPWGAPSFVAVFLRGYRDSSKTQSTSTFGDCVVSFIGRWRAAPHSSKPLAKMPSGSRSGTTSARSPRAFIG